MTKRQKVLWGVGGAVAVLLAAVVVVALLRPRFGGEINALGVDLAKPDAWLRTPSLSALPRDLVRAPLLRDLLTEDFAFYYEEHEDRLGFVGAVRRIAYEHEKTLPDRLLELALDGPAEMSFWIDAKGAPRHWLLAMTRGPLARAMQDLGTVAASDKQLSVIATVRAAGGDVTAYALRLSPRRTLGLLARGDRVLVLSDPGLLFNAERNVDAAALAVVETMLAADPSSQSAHAASLGVEGVGAGTGAHTLVADARLLSLGYRHFFPAWQALRVDVGAGGGSLQARLRLRGGGAPAAPAAAAADRDWWTALPTGAAACAVLPIEWSALKDVMAAPQAAPALGADRPRWDRFADALEGPAAVCWYARSRLHTPIVVARTKAGVDEADVAFVLEAASGWLAPAAAGAASAAGGAPAVATPPAASPGAGRGQQEVEAPWGPHGEGEETSYRPTFARSGRWITFSPDDRLVDLAVDAQARRFPSLAEALPAAGSTLAFVAPRPLADLVEREAFAVVGTDQELFRKALQQRLGPRLEALRRLPTGRAVAGGAADAQGWVGIDWQALAAAVPTSASAPAPAPASASASAPAPTAKTGRGRS